MVQLRPASAADAPALAALSIETWLNTYICAGLGQVRAEYVLREFSPDAMAWAIAAEDVIVADGDGGVTGYARARHGRDAPAPGCHGTELVTLYVRPAMQGRGIGRMLLSDLLSDATGRHSPAIWLTVNCKNHRAQGFYATQGFDTIGQTDFILNAKRYPNYLLRRDLPRAG